MTNAERRVIEEWQGKFGDRGFGHCGYYMAAMIEDLLNADKPDRPEVGTQFWLKGAGDSRWEVWMAGKEGPAYVDGYGNYVDYSWEAFSDRIYHENWHWKPLEQPND